MCQQEPVFFADWHFEGFEELAEALRLLQPYVSVRFMEQVKAVVPLALYLALFQILFLRQMVEDSWSITGGLFAVIAGLMFFMEGANSAL